MLTFHNYMYIISTFSINYLKFDDGVTPDYYEAEGQENENEEIDQYFTGYFDDFCYCRVQRQR